VKWLFTIDTENDLIVFCRLVNIFRRKGLNISWMSIGALSGAYRIIAVFQGSADEIDHIFHFVRRTEGVCHVAYYREGGTGPASFVFSDGEGEAPEAARWPDIFPGARLAFAGQGKLLLEIPPGATSERLLYSSPAVGFARFSRVSESGAGTARVNGNHVP
jgi:hypothetical protein